MKQIKRSLFALALLFLLFIAQQFGLIGPLLTRMSHIAWWVYLVIAGILFSGYQAYALTKQDQVIDDQLNEQQGDVYMKRMQDEKERRKQAKKTKAI